MNDDRDIRSAISRKAAELTPGPRRAHATVWCQIAAVWWPWQPPSLKGLRVVRITQKRPRRPDPGCIIVKLKIGLPEAAFLPPVVTAEVDPGRGEYVVTPVSAEAEPLDGG